MKKFMLFCMLILLVEGIQGQQVGPGSPKASSKNKHFNILEMFPFLNFAPVAPATDLSWDEPTIGCSGNQTCTYNIWRGPTSGSETKIVVGVVPTSYDDLNVSRGSSYYYVVTAQNAQAESGKSNEIFVTIPSAAIAPTGLTVTTQ